MPSYYYTKFQKNPCVGRNERCPFDRVITSIISIFYFQDNNLSKCLWIFTKCAMSINIVAVWFVIAQWQILSIFDRCPRHDNCRILSFHVFIYCLCIAMIY